MDEQHVPMLKQGDKVENITVQYVTGETKPPERFTEGTLLKAMENPARFMAHDEKHLAKTLHDTGGLGTVATRADIIEKLFFKFFDGVKREIYPYHIKRETIA